MDYFSYIVICTMKLLLRWTSIRILVGSCSPYGSSQFFIAIAISSNYYLTYVFGASVFLCKTMKPSSTQCNPLLLLFSIMWPRSSSLRSLQYFFLLLFLLLFYRELPHCWEQHLFMKLPMLRINIVKKKSTFNYSCVAQFKWKSEGSYF